MSLQKILLCGAKGRMGLAIQDIADQYSSQVSYPIDVGDDPKECIAECDVVIDFSLRDATLPLAALSADFKKPMVIGTTGHEPHVREKIIQFTKTIPIVWAGNFSTGVNLLFYLTEQASKVLNDGEEFDPEVIEMHHRLKKDAPSGTAERLLEIIRESRSLSPEQVQHGRSGMIGGAPSNEIGSHALRGGCSWRTYSHVRRIRGAD